MEVTSIMTYPLTLVNSSSFRRRRILIEAW